MPCVCGASFRSVRVVKTKNGRYRQVGTCTKGHKFSRFTKAPSKTRKTAARRKQVYHKKTLRPMHAKVVRGRRYTKGVRYHPYPGTAHRRRNAVLMTEFKKYNEDKALANAVDRMAGYTPSPPVFANEGAFDMEEMKRRMRERHNLPMHADGIHLAKGTLTNHGYHANLSPEKRHAALRRAVQMHGPTVVLRKLRIVATLSKNKRPAVTRAMKADAGWVKRTFGTTAHPKTSQ